MRAVDSLESGLRSGAAALQLRLSDAQVSQLLTYLALLQKWNKVYNLSAVRQPQEMLSQHLLDSLAAVPPLQRHLDAAELASPRLLDVGSGGGLPGVVFAICCPGLAVDCVDAVGKKAAFIQQAAAQLQLPRLRGIHNRVEAVAGPYDVVSCRAFASLPDFVRWSQHALAEGGVWLAMKGKHPEAELAEVAAEAEVFHVEQLSVPGLDADRCIVWMRPRAARAESATGVANPKR